MKRKTDPARMATVLYVTAEVLRNVALLVQPVMPGAMAQAARPARRRRPAARDFARRGGRAIGWRAGTPLPRPGAIFPRYVEPDDGGPALMLIDSHCHLDFPDFAAELDAVVERAPGGRRRAG